MSIKILEGNETYIRVVGPKDVRDALFNYFSYYVPNYERMPKYKEKDDEGNPKWDGKIHLYNRRSGAIYKGLLKSVQAFLKLNGWDYDIDSSVLPAKVTDEAILEVFDGIALPYQPHAWQVRGFFSACRNQRRLFMAATGTGKSLLIYMLARYLPGPTLIVVPTKGLIAQATKDFQTYDPTWDISKSIQIIKGGLEKKVSKPIVVSTWQSIYDLTEDWYYQFNQIIGDEAHEFTASSLIGLMEKAIDTPLRFGFTGTIEDTKADKMLLEGVFGPIETLITTSEGIEKNILSPLKIEVIVFDYPDKERRKCPHEYKGEMDFICQHERRNQFIVDLAADLKGNTLILFQYVSKHGVKLFEKFQTEYPDRQVYIVHGKIEDEDREIARIEMNEADNAVIAASYQTYQRGVNIPRLHNIIFAHPSKSKIRVIQSIGRGLRKADDKTHATLYDLVDDFSTSRRINYTFEHYHERAKYYLREGHTYTQHKVKL